MGVERRCLRGAVKKKQPNVEKRRVFAYLGQTVIRSLGVIGSVI